ncbi:MAG: ABC transporter permease [Chloroflexota bacterium]|nr:ABC transporter permease [Chloroflexota bacterium]
MGNFTFVGRRIIQLIPVLFGVTVITFFLIHLIPGDPVVAMLGNHYTPATAAAMRHALGLDRPLWSQYLIFMGNLFHGNLGTSIYYDQPVLGLILERLEPTAWLVLYSCILALVIAIPLAVVAAVNRNGILDQVIRAAFVVTLAMPAFWFGIILILLLSINLRLFPVTGFGSDFVDHLWHLFLPALTIALAFGAVLIRSLRNSILSVLREDYIRTARAKGVGRVRLMTKHVLRNAFLPTVTIFGVNVAFLIGSTVIIENVFAIGGVGQLLVSSILQRDYLVVQGITLLLAVFVVVVNLLTDVTYALLDPRITYD